MFIIIISYNVLLIIIIYIMIRIICGGYLLYTVDNPYSEKKMYIYLHKCLYLPNTFNMARM